MADFGFFFVARGCEWVYGFLGKNRSASAVSVVQYFEKMWWHPGILVGVNRITPTGFAARTTATAHH